MAEISRTDMRILEWEHKMVYSDNEDELYNFNKAAVHKKWSYFSPPENYWLITITLQSTVQVISTFTCWVIHAVPRLASANLLLLLVAEHGEERWPCPDDEVACALLDRKQACNNSKDPNLGAEWVSELSWRFYSTITGHFLVSVF